MVPMHQQGAGSSGELFVLVANFKEDVMPVSQQLAHNQAVAGVQHYSRIECGGCHTQLMYPPVRLACFHFKALFRQLKSS